MQPLDTVLYRNPRAYLIRVFTRPTPTDRSLSDQWNVLEGIFQAIIPLTVTRMMGFAKYAPYRSSQHQVDSPRCPELVVVAQLGQRPVSITTLYVLELYSSLCPKSASSSRDAIKAALRIISSIVMNYGHWVFSTIAKVHYCSIDPTRDDCVHGKMQQHTEAPSGLLS